MTTKELIKGVGISVTLGIVALALSYVVPLLGSIVLGLLIGILVGNSFKLPLDYSKGINYTSSKMLEFSLLFLALGINFTYISKIGYIKFLYLALAVLLVLVVTYLFSRKSSSSDSTQLVGFGTAICGSSAIAAISPSLSSKKEDIGISLAVVNLLGTLGMLALPVLLSTLEFDDVKSGWIIGGSLHSVANVAGAGYAMSEDTFRIAITVKLARVALLSPALIFFSFLARRHAVKNWKEHFNLPWYVWSFIGITILSSFVKIPTEVVSGAEFIGKIILTIAMTAIGLKVSFKNLFLSGKKAIAFGLIIFLFDLLVLFGLSALN